MLESTLLSSTHAPFLTTFDIAFRSKNSDSIADEDLVYPALIDPKITTYADHLAPGNGIYGHASNKADQWRAVRGRSADEEHVSPGMRSSSKPNITAIMQREELCEGLTNTDMPAATNAASRNVRSSGITFIGVAESKAASYEGGR